MATMDMHRTTKPKPTASSPAPAGSQKLRQDPFSVNGSPGPLGRELLAKFAGMSTALDRPVSLEDVMDGLRPRWAVSAMTRCVAAGWMTPWETAGTGEPRRYFVTAEGWEVFHGKRTA